MLNFLISITSRASLGRSKTLITSLLDEGSNVHVALTASSTISKFGDVRPEFNLMKKEYKNLTLVEFNTLVESSSKSSLEKTLALGILSLSDYVSNEKIDSIITVADRFETLASSIVASYKGIFLAHLQGGERSGNIDDKVRNANTTLADIHFPTTDKARARLLGMTNSRMIFNFGCPSIDLARQSLQLEPTLPTGTGKNFELNQPFIIVMQHPEYPCEYSAIEQIEGTLNAVTKFDLPILWFWPNADFGTEDTVSQIRKRREKGELRNIFFIKNTDPLNFLAILRNAKVLIGNSSAGIREASFFGIRAVNIGTRQSNRERANNVIDADYDSESIYFAIRNALDAGSVLPSSIFGDGYSGNKIARQLIRALK